MLDFDSLLKACGEVGYVVLVTHTVAQVEGLPGAVLGEKVVFETGQEGQVLSLSAQLVEVSVLAVTPVRAGTRVARTGQRLAVVVGNHLLGKTVNSLGKTLGRETDGESQGEARPVDIHAPGISARAKISRPLETGVAIVDLMVPIGRGQRELVMGDRKTGKSYLLLNSAVSQTSLGGVCVYACIGKKKQEIRRVEEYLKTSGALPNTVIVASSSHDPAGQIHLTPYTAMTIAEYFRDLGRDVLVILDDMTTHAKFYREVALLGRRFPGRDSYPGDVFYTQSRLLERAGNFALNGREVAITCLPVVETTLGDFTGFIQTNLMSMTDGHIYFDSDLYFAGRRPAVNNFISVTRVGHQTQSRRRREIYQATLDLISNYLKTQEFVRFGAELGDNSRQVLALGDRLLGFFDQPRDMVMPTNVQTVLWGLLWAGVWDSKNAAKLVDSYRRDTKLRTLVNNLVTNSDSVSSLLANVQAKSDELLPILKT